MWTVCGQCGYVSNMWITSVDNVDMSMSSHRPLYDIATKQQMYFTDKQILI